MEFFCLGLLLFSLVQLNDTACRACDRNPNAKPQSLEKPSALMSSSKSIIYSIFTFVLPVGDQKMRDL